MGIIGREIYIGLYVITYMVVIGSDPNIDHTLTHQ